MTWVKSEYAPELAVLSTWLVALLPWSGAFVSFQLAGRQVSVVVIRFLYFRLQYIFGISVGKQERPLLWVYNAPAFTDTAPLANWAWVAGAAISLLPIALSVSYYLSEAGVETVLSVDPVRLQGVLLSLLGVVLGVSTVLFWQTQRYTLPVGTVFALGFGYILLTVDRTEDPEATDGE